MDILSLFHSKAIETVVDNVAKATQDLAVEYMLPLFLTIAVVKMIWNYWTENNHQWGVDMKEMTRIFLLVFMLYAFPSVMTGVNTVMEGVIAGLDLKVELANNSFKTKNSLAIAVSEHPTMSDIQKEMLEKKLKTSNDHVKTINQFIDEEGLDKNDLVDDITFGMKKMISTLESMGNNFLLYLLTRASTELLFVVKIIMWALILSFTLIIYCIGPLAIAVDLIFPGQLKKWFLTFATAKMTIVSMAVIEAINTGIVVFLKEQINNAPIINGVQEYLGGKWEGAMTTYLMSSIVITSIAMYVMSFWFTSKWFGSEDAGKMMSATGGAAMATMSGGITKMSKTLTDNFKKGINKGGDN